jgi:hypothetical protein
MITFHSEEDAAAAFKIAGSPRIAKLAMEISKDSQDSNEEDSEHFLAPAASQGKSDERKPWHESLAHKGKASQTVKSIFSLQDQEERDLSSGNELQ